GTIRGRLTVLGWALSPHGINRVRVHFGNGRVSMDAPLAPRSDVTQTLPWYPRKDHVSFGVVFTGPPSGIRGETDMQIEAIDGAGLGTFFRPSFFRWFPAPKSPCVWKETRLDALLARLGEDYPKHKQSLIENTESLRDIIGVLSGDS